MAVSAPGWWDTPEKSHSCTSHTDKGGRTKTYLVQPTGLWHWCTSWLTYCHLAWLSKVFQHAGTPFKNFAMGGRYTLDKSPDHHNPNNVNQHLLKSFTRGNSWADIMALLASKCDERGQSYPLLSCLAAVQCHSASRVNCERDFSAVSGVKVGGACSGCRSVRQTFNPLHFYFQDYSGFRNRMQRECLTACQRISIGRPKRIRAQCRRVINTMSSTYNR